MPSTASIGIENIEAHLLRLAWRWRLRAIAHWERELAGSQRRITFTRRISLTPVAQRVDQQRKRRRRLAAAWVPEVIA
jgi:hypothetical protein